MVGVPTVKAEVFWGYSRDGASTGTWADETANLKSFEVYRGRLSEVSLADPGGGKLTLDNSTGRYDPLNTASPLYGKLRPNRPVRITVPSAVTGTTDIQIGYGFTDRIERSWPGGGEYSQSNLTFTDESKFLARRRFGSVSYPAESTYDRMVKLLGRGGVSAAGLAPYGASDYQIAAIVYPSGSKVLDAIRDVMTSELISLFYFDGLGRPSYVRHDYRSATVGSAQFATYGNGVSGTDPNVYPVENDLLVYVDDMAMANYIEVVRNNGTVHTASDSAFINLDGEIDLTVNTVLDLSGDANDMASRLRGLKRDPQPRIDTIQVDATEGGAILTNGALRELNDLVAVNLAPQGGGTQNVETKFWVEGLRHEVDYAPNGSWLTTLNLSAV